MERKRRKNSRMTDARRNIIILLIQQYDIQSTDDLQDALKDLLGDIIQEMMEAEMTEHLGYDEYERSDSTNSRNGRKTKTIRSKYGKTTIEVSQDRRASFQFKIVKKRQKDISTIDNKIISMYAKSITTRQISEQIKDIYGFDVSESFVSDVTNKILL